MTAKYNADANVRFPYLSLVTVESFSFSAVVVLVCSSPCGFFLSFSSGLVSAWQTSEYDRFCFSLFLQTGRILSV